MPASIGFGDPGRQTETVPKRLRGGVKFFEDAIDQQLDHPQVQGGEPGEDLELVPQTRCAGPGEH